MRHYFRGIPVEISTHTVGQNFGTVAVARAMGKRWESTVRPLGFETAAIAEVQEQAAAWLAPFTVRGAR